MKKRIHWAANKNFYVETALFLIVNSGTSGLVLSYHVAAFSCTTLVTTLIFLNLLCNENHLNSFNFKFKKRRLTMKATQDLLLWLINFCSLIRKLYGNLTESLEFHQIMTALRSLKTQHWFSSWLFQNLKKSKYEKARVVFDVCLRLIFRVISISSNILNCHLNMDLI